MKATIKRHPYLAFYAAGVILAALYEKPWDITFWNAANGNASTGWLYTIVWPYAIYKEVKKT